MKSFLCLTPSSPGKPGQLLEVVGTEGPALYAEPVNPYLLNADDLGKLRSAVSDAETALRHAKSKNAGEAEITRLDRALTTAKRELDTVEYELRRNRQREQTGGNDVFTRKTAAELVASAVAGVAALMKKTPLACNASPRCVAGPGHYKCARCRAA